MNRAAGSTTPAIRTDRLSKHFGDTVAVDDLTLTVEQGKVFGFLGPNGAGKSTTIRMLLGLARPSAGQAWIFDEPAGNVRAAHRHLAYVPADVALWPNLTGAEILTLLAQLGPGVDEVYRGELVDRFALEPDRRARTYSTGNRQKVALVAAFATRAPLLVFDEPTSGLDPLMEREFQACVTEAARRGQTVFLSSHQLAEVEKVCDRVGILRAGRLADVAGLDELRRLHRTEFDVTFLDAADVPADLELMPGVEKVSRPAPGRAVLTLSGPPGPVLRAISSADITRLDVREASLEEIFLDYYGQAAS